MSVAAISAIVLLALTLCRFVFTILEGERLVTRTGPPMNRHDGLLQGDIHVLDQAGLVETAGNPENRTVGVDDVAREHRPQCYLQRIASLTGAKQVGSAYALDINHTRFEVRDRYVRRVRDVTDPRCAYEETCFYTAQREMPKAEQIATALLQIKSNPALFDRWAAQNGAFKADGQPFGPKL